MVGGQSNRVYPPQTSRIINEIADITFLFDSMNGNAGTKKMARKPTNFIASYTLLAA